MKLSWAMVGASLLIWFPALPVVAQTESQTMCAESVSKPGYPPLAVAARVQGVVNVQLEIAPNGSVSNADVHAENPILSGSLASMLRQAKFDSRCAGKLDLIYKFAIGEREGTSTTVKFNPPNEYLVTSDYRGPLIIDNAVTAKSRFKRFLGFLTSPFHRN
jgi:hypothetical protein